MATEGGRRRSRPRGVVPAAQETAAAVAVGERAAEGGRTGARAAIDVEDRAVRLVPHVRLRGVASQNIGWFVVDAILSLGVSCPELLESKEVEAGR